MDGVSDSLRRAYESARAHDMARPDMPPPEPRGKWLLVVNASDGEIDAVRAFLRRLELSGARPRRIPGWEESDGEDVDEA